jgi:peptide/nickel transport system substrate-binding protein
MSMRVLTSLLLAAVVGFAAPAGAESVVRYGISMSDIPLTTGQPDRGAGAYQFTGLTIYDPLVAWELNVTGRESWCPALRPIGRSIRRIRRSGRSRCARA